MASPNDTISMALYCDFENVALGVRDAKYDKFDIKPVLERLLLKGSIVLKKAYCDWDRYKEFKPQMHEASFELIEIPHVRQSGKNSADIRMVVDALDLCYTKAHVNTFVIISGDSDFSPLVSKLRENAKYVIGVGVKNSTSDLLIGNCDEFIFIDDLVRESRRKAATRDMRQAQPATRRSSDDEQRRKEEQEARKILATDMAAETFEALMAERGDSGKIWASALKQAIKRRKPDFNETYFGFRTFGNLLEEAQSRGLLDIGRDDKSGTYVYRSSRTAAGDTAASLEGGATSTAAAAGKHAARHNARPERRPIASAAEASMPPPSAAVTSETPLTNVEPAQTAAPETAIEIATRREEHEGRTPIDEHAEPAIAPSSPVAPEMPAQAAQAAPQAAPQEETPKAVQNAPRRNTRSGRKPAQKKAQTADVAPQTAAASEPATQTAASETAAKPARKTGARTRRPRKAETVPATNGDSHE